MKNKQLILDFIYLVICVIAGLVIGHFSRVGFPVKPLSNESKYPVYSGRNVYEYWRTTLNENEQKLYDEVKEAYLQFDAGFLSRAKNEISKDRAKDIYYAVFYDHPEIFWLDYHYGIKTTAEKDENNKEKFDMSKQLELVYIYDKESSQKMKKTIEENIKEMIEEAKKLDSDYEKVKFIHDEFIERGMYNKSHSSNNEFQSIVELFGSGETVCAGFAYGFKYIMDILDIDSITCVSEDHAWNMVKIDDKWYNLDITYDNSKSDDFDTIAYNYFLKTNEEFFKELNHDEPLQMPEFK